MSFTFQWPHFSDQFHTDAIQMLNNALNKGNKPPVIADKIEVVELEMGTQPPELEIRDIGDLTTDHFRGIFRLSYAGDAHLVLKTKVQANPLNHKQQDIHLMTGSRGMLAAKEPLAVPMLLRLSHFKLNSYVVLVVSKQKGITLVFKTDPLQNVDINSTFDSIVVIQKFIQREIEGQLRQMFREDLPGIIHRLSQKWVKAKVEAPYLDKRPPPAVHRQFDAASSPDLSHLSDGLYSPGHPALQQSFVRAPSSSGASVAASARRKLQPIASAPVTPPKSETAGSLPELENFDPTYGLRPDALPAKSIFSNFGRLFKPDKGLADLMEESEIGDEEREGEEKGPYSVSDWDDASIDFSAPASLAPGSFVAGYQTPPRTNSFPYGVSRIPLTHRPTPSYDPHFPETPVHISSERQRTHSEPAHDLLSLRLRREHRPITPDSFETQFSRSSSGGLARSIETPASTDPPHSPHGQHDPVSKPPSLSFRRLSVSSSAAANLDPFHSGSPPSYHAISESDPRIILRPTLNNSLHQLSTLSHSNHTLSPYTRSMEHYAVRSGPPRMLDASGVRAPPERRPVKAKRKRTYRIGGKPQSQPDPELDNHPSRTSPPSPIPPSEFDPSEIDRYFRSGNDVDGLVREPGSSDHARQRFFVPDSLPRAPSSVSSQYSRDAYETLRQRRR